MSLWIAREKSGALWLYETKPKRCSEGFYAPSGYWEKPLRDDSLFPEVTWENSLRRVKLEIALL